MHSVIYVPGLGDERPFGQKAIITSWRLLGLHAHYFALGWNRNEPFEAKLKRLLAEIDRLSKAGPVSLVGISAGASAVLNAFAQRPNVASVVCLCGKINNPQTVHPLRFERHPSLKGSLYMVADSLARMSVEQRSHIMSIHPLADGTVPIRDTIIPRAVEKLIRTRGHIFTIFYTIIFRSRMISKFLNNPRA